jgi:small nuclear ribonucleoprotein (snRNP)-like protein
MTWLYMFIGLARKKNSGDTVALITGVDYRGVLACLDGYMNIALEQTEVCRPVNNNKSNYFIAQLIITVPVPDTASYIRG